MAERRLNEMTIKREYSGGVFCEQVITRADLSMILEKTDAWAMQHDKLIILSIIMFEDFIGRFVRIYLLCIKKLGPIALI